LILLLSDRRSALKVSVLSRALDSLFAHDSINANFRHSNVCNTINSVFSSRDEAFHRAPGSDTPSNDDE
jgi:hypothetical protein